MIKLCVRPLPQPGESTEGYFRRLAVKNGNMTFSSFVRELFDGKVNSFRKLDYAAISSATGHPTEQLKNLQLVKGRFSALLYNGQAIRTHHLLGHQHYCPDCVKELGYLKARWNLAWLPVCTTHHRQLVPVCNLCVQQLLAGSSNVCEKCVAPPIENIEMIEYQRFLEEQLENPEHAKKVISTVDQFYHLRISGFSNFKRDRVRYNFPQRAQVYFDRNESNAAKLVQELYERLVA